MGLNVSRRDFLKKTSLAAAAVSAAPISSFAASKNKKQEKSRVVIATDTDCSSGATFDDDRIQDMVDYAIINLTGVNNRAKAYEALFPEPVTKDTTIAIKKNSASAGSRNRSWPHVRDALIKGLTYMLDGTFPESNITVSPDGSSNNSNPSFKVGNNTYRFLNPWAQSDYVINTPVCWGHSQYGVTLNLKNMMSSVTNVMSFHDFDYDYESNPWMSVLNSQDSIKGKLVLSLMDSITGRAKGGPGGSADYEGHCVIAGKDIVACDYQGMLILKENGLSSSKEATGRVGMKCAAQSPYDLGTDDPDEMEVMEIGPPWDPTEVIPVKGSTKLSSQVKVTTRSSGSNITFQFNTPAKENANLSIFNVQGKHIWSFQDAGSNRIVWTGKDILGRQVPQGMYVYNLEIRGRSLNGRVEIKR